MTTRERFTASPTRSKLASVLPEGALAAPSARFIALVALLVVLLPGATHAADAEAGRRKTEACGACHGPNGNSTLPMVPSLAAQPPTYTYYQLVMFKRERRRDAQMSPFATNLGDDDMQDIAAYYAAQTPATPPGALSPDIAEAGGRLVQQHYCSSCHTPSLMGQKHIPRLAGQQK